MIRENNKVMDLKIAYIGGGSRGWARGLMSDLAKEERMSGNVYLYDIDFNAALDNEKIGNRFNDLKGCKSKWNYIAVKTAKEAMENADFVVISILPGTFDEMGSDIHTPEEYGIYQSVGDSVGPGGLIRAIRTIPMFKEIALNVKKYCPNAWVINYTNPMTVCTRTLYEVFPEIKAIGCCHEVFAVQELIANIYNEYHTEKVVRQQIDVNIIGINHFTWFNKIKCMGEDLMPMMRDYVSKHPDGELTTSLNWMNKNFVSNHAIKFDLFRRYGILAAAGDRHLCEFCPRQWYLKDKETVKKYMYKLTPISWRKDDQKEKIQKTKDILEGKLALEIEDTGEEGVKQMAALLGLNNFVTNVNLPNIGQIENLPLGAVVETNAYISGDSIVPLCSGSIPDDVNHLVSRHVYNQELTVKAVLNEDYEKVFNAFVNDPLMDLPVDEAKKLFNKMLENTKQYLPAYDKYVKNNK